MSRVATPVHLWIIGVATLLWNAMGGFDYIMTQTRNESYMGQFTQEQLDYFYGFPAWMEFFWALAVWGSIVGSLLLLLRRGLALPVFAVSFVSMLVTSVYNFALSDGARVMGVFGVFFSIAIFIIALFLVIYARAMKERGVLA